jgi:hypothetical protein
MSASSVIILSLFARLSTCGKSKYKGCTTSLLFARFLLLYARNISVFASDFFPQIPILRTKSIQEFLSKY